MSIQAVAWALEQDLPARPKLVLVALCNHANNVDGYCWLKAETIAREASCSPRGVYNFVGALIRNGFIRKALRKGDDGKQRSTDYWILLDRADAPWVFEADAEADATDGEALEIEGAEASSTISGEPHAPGADGENTEPDAPGADGNPVEKPPGADGPVASACHRKRIAEPSKTNPKASSAGVRVRDVALRAYRPPPPQPLGADPALPTKQVFVYENSRAYDAWAIVEAKKAGLRTWHLTTRALIDGQWRSGWYFPTLFPPNDSKSTDPPKESSAA